MHSHHISVTDVCVAPSTLYPAHGGHRNAKSLPTIQDKRALSGWREGLGLCECEWRGAGGLDEEISPHLLHYVAPAQEAH